MPRRDVAVRLRHMLDHAREASAMASGKTADDIAGDRQLQLALVRLLEIVGEAASQISREEQDQLSDIAWPEIVAFRNRLIHGYDSVDLAIVWRVIQQDIPELVKVLEKILSPGEP